MPDRCRLGGLEIGVVGSERPSQRLRLCGKCRAHVTKCGSRAGQTIGRDEAQRHAKRLTTRTTSTQPTCGTRTDTGRQFLLAILEGIAHGWIPRKVARRDRVKLEQATLQLGPTLRIKTAALDQRNRVSKVRARERIRQRRTCSRFRAIASAHELVRRTSRQAPSHSEMTISHTSRVAVAQGLTGQMERLVLQRASPP